jgi:regulatory protein
MEPEADARIVAVRGTGRRVRVTLSDGREVLCSEEACLRAGIAEGMEATEEILERLRAGDERVVAHGAALRLLKYRNRSEREIRAALTRRGVSSGAADEEIARLTEAGLLDDGRFAQQWVDERVRLAPRSRRLLRHELQLKGIRGEPAESAVAEVDDAATAVALARKKVRGAAGGLDDAFLARVGAFLRRRGFGEEHVREALRAARDEAPGAGNGRAEIPE